MILKCQTLYTKCRTTCKYYYNIARALVLSNMEKNLNQFFMYARPCSIKWRVQFQFSASSFCLSFGNVKIILNNPNATSSLLLLPSKDVHLNVSVFTLFIYIFIEYFDFVCLHYIFIIINFPLIILKTRLSVFVQRIFNWLWRFRILITFVPSPCIVRTL